MEHKQKNPKQPAFPPSAAATAHKLQLEIDTGGDRATKAYQALTRLSVLWAPDHGLSHAALTTLVNELLDLTMELFPEADVPST